MNDYSDVIKALEVFKDGKMQVNGGLLLKSILSGGTDRTPVVYFLLKNGKIVYIGSTKRILHRLRQHDSGRSGIEKKEFTEVALLEVPECSLEIAEEVFISMLNPELNTRQKLFFIKLFAEYIDMDVYLLLKYYDTSHWVNGFPVESAIEILKEGLGYFMSKRRTKNG